MVHTRDTSNPLVDELGSAVRSLRGALTELLSGIDADPARPLALSRALKVDKSLAWKVSNIVKANDPSAAVQYLPGSAAFDILLNAVKRRCPNSKQGIARAREAMHAIEIAVQRHAGDRPTLELVLDGLPGAAEERLLRSRKLAFRGNSGIWGVQARTRVNTAILAPSRDAPGMVDQAMVGGWIDFRRLRADTRWALFRRRRTHIDKPASRDAVGLGEPIDVEEPADGPMLIREFCSDTLPPIQVVRDTGGDLVHELGPSPVGNSGAFTCFFGALLRKIGPRFADSPDDQADFGAVISAPVENLQFDLIVHRSLLFALRARADVYGTLAGRHSRDLLPLELKPANLGSFPPVVDTPLVPRYRQIIEHVLSRCGWDADEFAAIRYVVEYPPFPSQVVISFPLERRPLENRAMENPSLDSRPLENRPPESGSPESRPPEDRPPQIGPLVT